MPLDYTALDKARRERGLTYAKLAHELKVHPVTVQKWFGGATTPTLSHLEALCKQLGIEIRDVWR